MPNLVNFSREPSTAQLRKLHFWLFAIYALEAAAFLLLATVVSVPISASFLQLDSVQSTSLGSVVLAPATHRLFDFKVTNVAATVLIISALSHLIMATWRRAAYEKGLNQGTNTVRWVQIGLANAFILSTVAALAGDYDAMSLLLVFILPLITAGLAALSERQNPLRARGAVKWGSYMLAVASAVLPWLVIGGYLLFANLYGDGRIPASTYWLAGVLAVLFAGYAGIAYLQLKRRGPWKQYRYSECSYAIWTLVVQTVFVCLLYAGVLNP